MSQCEECPAHYIRYVRLTRFPQATNVAIYDTYAFSQTNWVEGTQCPFSVNTGMCHAAAMPEQRQALQTDKPCRQTGPADRHAALTQSH